MRRASALLLSWLAATAAGAAEPVAAAGLPRGGDLAQVVLSLLLVLALIAGMAWLARRLRLVQHRAGDAIRVLADLPLGPRERVVLLAVGDRQALVGVSGAGVTTLELLEQPVALQAGVAAAPSPLAERFRSVLDRGGRA